MIRTSHLLRESAANWAMGLAFVRKWRVKHGRTLTGHASAQIRLILDQFDFFIEAIGWERVQGKTIIEIGPGDAIPHGLLFLGAGAKRYVAVDRFLGGVSNASAQNLYRALILAAPDRIIREWSDSGLDPYRYPFPEAGRKSPAVGLVAESIEETDFKGMGTGDVILSFNVIEHLSDLSRAFANMARMLNPDGLMIHRVDYGPHHLWRTYRNPLTFLTASQRAWSLMGGNRGYPNRKRHSQVLAVLCQSGFRNADRITGRFSIEDIKEVRPFLAEEFRDLPDEDLQTADAEICSAFSPIPKMGGHGFRHISKP